MKVLITGPDGFIGTKLCQIMIQNHILVYGALQQPIALPQGCESIVIGDIEKNVDWSPALENIGTLVHLAARVHVMQDTAADPLEEFRKVNVEGTRRLAEKAAEAGVGRFLFLSSVKVNGEKTEQLTGPFTESSEEKPEDPYAVSKWEAEQVLREIEARTGMEVVIIRPPLIYGPGVKANFLKLIQLVDRGIPLPFGLIKNRRSFLSLTNIADLICHCLEHPAAGGQTFLASDGEDVSTPELVRRISKALGRPARLLPVPEWLMKFGGTITGKSAQVDRLCGTLQIDSSKVRNLLGWTVPSSMEEELAKIAEWYKSTDYAD